MFSHYCMVCMRKLCIVQYEKDGAKEEFSMKTNSIKIQMHKNWVGKWSFFSTKSTTSTFFFIYFFWIFLEQKYIYSTCHETVMKGQQECAPVKKRIYILFLLTRFQFVLKWCLHPFLQRWWTSVGTIFVHSTIFIHAVGTNENNWIGTFYDFGVNSITYNNYIVKNWINSPGMSIQTSI